LLNRLYLDNARLGLMSRSAQLMEHAFVRLAGEGTLTLYFSEWLRDGMEVLPHGLQRRFSGLSAWQGIGHLKRNLRQLAGAASDSRVLVANRSAQLMKLAAKLLFERCHNVLTTDLSWPCYQRILETEARRTGRQVTRVALRRRLLGHRIGCYTATDMLSHVFARHDCDGLFLPAVDNLGVRLPVENIVATIGRRREIRFTAIDGAQALAHVPIQLDDNTCDLFLAGVHKWLRAYHPMGIAYYGHPRSAATISAALQRYLAGRRIDDPLLRLTDQLEHNQATGYGETVSVMPLITTQGALCDTLAHGNRPESTIGERVANADRLTCLARKLGWRSVRPARPMRTGICLFRATGDKSTWVTPKTMRDRFRNAGVTVTTYPRGLVRFSMPPTAWTESESENLSRALALCFPAKGKAASGAIA
jgi:selenocysteine lyase/cysteine desulfurase